MRTHTSLGAALFAVLGTALVATGAAGASSEAAPTTTVPAPPPTCTCPPATTAAPTTAAAAPTTATAAGPTTAAAPTTAAGGATPAPPTTAGGATTVPGGVAPAAAGTGFPANATLDQIMQHIQPMFGPTTDAMGEFAIFGITPLAGVPTPAGAEIDEFEFNYDDLADDEPFFNSTLLFRSSQPASELVTLYQTELVAAGFTQTGDSVDNTDGGAQIRRLEYDAPNPTHSFSKFEVAIVDADVDYVQIDWWDGLTPAAAESARAAFTIWPTLPLIDQAELIENVRIGNFISGDRLHLDTGYRIPIVPAELEPQFLAGLAGGPFTQDVEASEPGSWASLDGGGFDDMTVHFTESYIEGATTLNVSSYIVL